MEILELAEVERRECGVNKVEKVCTFPLIDALVVSRCVLVVPSCKGPSECVFRGNRKTLTDGCFLPLTHHLTQACDNLPCFNGSALRLGLLVEVDQSNTGNFVAAELCQELLLRRQVQVLV